jgi:hypothetical protein
VESLHLHSVKPPFVHKWTAAVGDNVVVTAVRGSGQLNGDGIEVTPRKIGDDWFVIDLTMQYVS